MAKKIFITGTGTDVGKSLVKISHGHLHFFFGRIEIVGGFHYSLF